MRINLQIKFRLMCTYIKWNSFSWFILITLFAITLELTMYSELMWNFGQHHVDLGMLRWKVCWYNLEGSYMISMNVTWMSSMIFTMTSLIFNVASLIWFIDDVSVPLDLFSTSRDSFLSNRFSLASSIRNESPCDAHSRRSRSASCFFINNFCNMVFWTFSCY